MPTVAEHLALLATNILGRDAMGRDILYSQKGVEYPLRGHVHRAANGATSGAMDGLYGRGVGEYASVFVAAVALDEVGITPERGDMVVDGEDSFEIEQISATRPLVTLLCVSRGRGLWGA